MKKDNLGDRMKQYEEVSSVKLVRRTPVILRLDGKAFHTFTHGMKKPFDSILSTTMIQTTSSLVKNIQNCQLGYVQSDEISLLLIDDKTIRTSSWFDNKIQKQSSIAASMCTLFFNEIFMNLVFDDKTNPEEIEEIKNGPYFNKIMKALFDCRAFNVPKEDVCNYFIWRQQDAARNSIQSVAQANFSHKELQGLNTAKLNEKLWSEKKINWNDIPTIFKRGTCVYKNNGEYIVDEEIPIFSQNREFIEKHVNIKED